MVGKKWRREELLLAMKLYYQLPFGQMHKDNLEVEKLARVIDRTPSSVAMKLANFASLDPDLRERGLKGLPNASRADRDIWEKCRQNWDEFANESEKISDDLQWDSGRGFEGELEKIVSKTVRTAQRFFRQVVLASYDNRCCISGLDLPALLVASHIKPWSQFPAERLDPQNGLCLSRLHDAAFDCGLITIDIEKRLVLSRELKSRVGNRVVSESFQEYEGKRIWSPEKLGPKEEYLKWHREHLFVDR